MSYLRDFYSNIIYPERFAFISKLYEKILKVLFHFCSVLIIAKNPNEKIKRTKLVHKVYDSYATKEFNFIWLSTIFYILISFVPVIYIVTFLNYTINDSIPSFKNFVLPLAREKAPGIEQNYFQTLFNTVIFDKFIPAEIYIFQ
ncbi:hypothetical protein [Mycoplasmopsis cynos]|uniref:hypothetical protein n=1 Tax=Mycoplasmopsis cynos TaxID=171284 RepID=UPI0021FAD079|nr:hypothetical protein [Mycoplasmopsis cynos]UWV77320.1 hypothetical protein NW070_06545 [Mycoplasmopsis cynos]